MLATVVNVRGVKLVSFLGLFYLVFKVTHQLIDDIRLLGKLSKLSVCYFISPFRIFTSAYGDICLKQWLSITREIWGSLWKEAALNSPIIWCAWIIWHIYWPTHMCESFAPYSVSVPTCILTSPVKNTTNMNRLIYNQSWLSSFEFLSPYDVWTSVLYNTYIANTSSS